MIKQHTVKPRFTAQFKVNLVFTDWGGKKVSEYWGNVFRCVKSGFTVNRGAVNRGFTVV